MSSSGGRAAGPVRSLQIRTRRRESEGRRVTEAQDHAFALAFDAGTRYEVITTNAEQDEDYARRVAQLNDRLRETFRGGQVLMTRTVSEDPSRERIAEAVRRYDFAAADGGNDPYGEHDFGSIELGGTNYFWKIDYYDPTLSWHSDDPTDSEKTRRVLTIMRADEY